MLQFEVAITMPVWRERSYTSAARSLYLSICTRIHYISQYITNVY
jgi:hypothetical protein